MTSETSLNHKVEKAQFRAAKPEEVAAAKGNLAWRCVTYPWYLACKVMGTFEIYRHRTNVLEWNTPYVQVLGERFSSWLGFGQDSSLASSLFSFFGDRYFIDDKTVMEAFFRHHRTQDIFTGTPSLNRFFTLVEKIFPEEQFSPDDFIFTCSREMTKNYRSLLHGVLQSTPIEKQLPVIKEIAKACVEDWDQECQEKGSINVTEATRLFTSRILTRLLFGDELASKEIAGAIKFINIYLIKKATGKSTADDEKQLNRTIVILREHVYTVLKKDQIPLFNSEKKFTPAQQKSMIVFLFFAGLETTASLLNYMLWQLAKNPKLQEQLRQEIMKNHDPDKTMRDFFTKSINEFTPAYGVARELQEDTCLEYSINGREHKMVMYKGQMVAVRIIGLAQKSLSENYNDWCAFGSGVHRCPGEHLAVQEIVQFLQALLSKYEFDTKQTSMIPMVGLVTAQLKEDIFINMVPRAIDLTSSSI